MRNMPSGMPLRRGLCGIGKVRKMNVTINDRTLEAEHGETILSVAARAGISIPTLCHIEGLPPTGACRMCVVEDMNTGRLIPSCSQPAAEGMNVRTHSAKALEARRTIVELLLANHPDDCLYCVRNGSWAPSPSNRVANTGITFHRMT